ncbi:hypothetical protein ACP275_11G108700 [Erythranthe tilingii]
MSPDQRSPEIEYVLSYTTVALMDHRPPLPPPGQAWFELRRQILDPQLKSGAAAAPIPSLLFNRSCSILKYGNDNAFVGEFIRAHRCPENVYPMELMQRAEQFKARVGQAMAKREHDCAMFEGDWVSQSDWAKIEEMWVTVERTCAATEEFWGFVRRFRANPDEGFKSWDTKRFLDECRHQQEKARAIKEWARERGWTIAEETMAKTEQTWVSTEETIIQIEQNFVEIEQNLVKIEQYRKQRRMYYSLGLGFIVGGVLNLYLS